MPLEKIALFMNSSQVSGKHQFAQSIKLTFQKGVLSPYRVVGPASLVAWFMQYSVMGLAFQFFDHALSKALGVAPVYYGDELMEPPPPPSSSLSNQDHDATHQIKSITKTILAPILAGSLESTVANRAEVQRYYGPTKLATIESHLKWNPAARFCGPAFLSNAMRNVIMCNTSFILTPITYKLYYPQEKKSQGSLFWFGMGMNFAGNAVAITQQALWGRGLDYAVYADGAGAAASSSAASSATQVARNISYSQVIKLSLQKDGPAAFFTVPKWASRILMNAPVQGSLPWFYNNVLPLGEDSVLGVVRTLYYGKKNENGKNENGCAIS
eukprot:CAMPEP_0201738960 /NCGR_PEP_ID=MMETSP0593-20130828/45521_1 /ASSEMBLY_ACC=CAM_ASM_000672 /TAXON_ID=267983 /ORGANISM="Skeletonema japonicum, Strain CCMP2506" /LENGTH=326 /DNA_ID=CAMNT_0048233191 /DNA_START=1337 /DNA_END=2317 /DNA_ORIENTATION=-